MAGRRDSTRKLALFVQMRVGLRFVTLPRGEIGCEACGDPADLLAVEY
jgi:hypothetical protein